MNTERLKQLPELSLLAACIILAVVFFGSTNPRNIASVLLIAGFGIIFVTVYLALRLFFKAIGVRARLSGVLYKALTLGGAALPVLLLALQSIGQLTTRDVVTIVTLFLAASFYITRLAPKR